MTCLTDLKSIAKWNFVGYNRNMSIKKATYNLTPEVVQKLAEIAQIRGNIKPSGGVNQSLTLRQLIEEAWRRERKGEKNENMENV